MRQRRLMGEINVVPYIDVMLVLLVIFMVTAPLIQTASIDLPTVGKAAAASSAPLEIIVRADQSLAWRDRTAGAAQSDEIPVTREALMDRLKAAKARNPDQAVLIAGDRRVPYEAVLKVMDDLQRQKIGKIGLLVQTENTH
jgi:biopolymer transport protein TolR